jgi:NTP pyrophosphatase (non-canonical NTP hydrolase)
MSELRELIRVVLKFRDDRNWKQFHSVRNLAAALAIESGELQELMLWKNDDEVQEFIGTPDGKSKLSAEIADILIYALLLCEASAVDPSEAIREKVAANAEKYPVALSRNKALKYTELK